MGSQGKVLIIGAGISGLCCAARLQNEFEVEVIESDSSAGGRLKSLAVGGHCIDAGAQFFSREDLNAKELVKELGLEGETREFDLSRFLVSDGKRTVSLKFNEEAGFSEAESRELDKFSSIVTGMGDGTPSVPRTGSANFFCWYKENVGSASLWIAEAFLRAIAFASPHELDAFYGIIAFSSFLAPSITIRGGLSRLSEQAKLKAKAAQFHFREPVSSIQFTGSKAVEVKTPKNVFKIGESDKVVLALPYPIASSLLRAGKSSPFANAEIAYCGCAASLQTYGEKPLGDKLGIMFSGKNMPVAAVFENTLKTAESELGSVVTSLMPYSGGRPAENEILTAASRQVGLGKPLATQIVYWDYGLPLASPEFFKNQALLEARLPQNVFLAGDFMGLPSLDAAIESSRACAEKILGK